MWREGRKRESWTGWVGRGGLNEKCEDRRTELRRNGRRWWAAVEDREGCRRWRAAKEMERSWRIRNGCTRQDESSQGRTSAEDGEVGDTVKGKVVETNRLGRIRKIDAVERAGEGWGGGRIV